MKKDELFCCIIISSGLKESSGQFTGSAMSDSATPWTAARQASLSITNSGRVLKLRPLSWWCHPTISSSVIPFFCLQSFAESGSFQMSQLFALGGQGIGVSASTSVLLMNTQDWFPLGWTGWISWSPRDSQESSPTTQFKSINSSVLSFL